MKYDAINLLCDALKSIVRDLENLQLDLSALESRIDKIEEYLFEKYEEERS